MQNWDTIKVIQSHCTELTHFYCLIKNLQNHPFKNYYLCAEDSLMPWITLETTISTWNQKILFDTIFSVRQHAQESFNAVHTLEFCLVGGAWEEPHQTWASLHM